MSQADAANFPPDDATILRALAKRLKGEAKSDLALHKRGGWDRKMPEAVNQEQALYAAFIAAVERAALVLEQSTSDPAPATADVKPNAMYRLHNGELVEVFAIRQARIHTWVEYKFANGRSTWAKMERFRQLIAERIA